MPSAEAATLCGKLANAARFRPGEDHTDLRRALKAQRLEDRIREIVETAPSLTPEQLDRLAALLLRPSTPDGRRSA